MNTARKVAFHTLGCKLNFSETSTIARLFGEHQFSKVDFAEAADVYVINTCSVTENANRECRSIVRKALRTSPNAFIAVIGCYAQLKPEEIAAIPGVDLVLGAAEKFNLVKYIESEKNFKAKTYADEIRHCNSFHASFSAGDRTRSFLKVQDGCDYFCSFCTIPLARGFSRSDTVASTLISAQKALETGVKEIVLTGVNIGDFGKQSPAEAPETFFDLVKAMDALDGLERIRISSIEPNLLSNEIIKAVGASKKFLPHFHIPMQSGSDKILKLMRRRYVRDLYADRIRSIRELMPNACIGADVIVGFPGETEDDFLDTYRFINELELSYLHVFTYSERDNTTAVRMDEIVPQQERQRRNRMLTILSEKKRRHFYEQQAGKTVSVLFEQEEKEGMIRGFSDNYVRVKVPFNAALVNTIMDVRLETIDQDGEFLGALLTPVLI